MSGQSANQPVQPERPERPGQPTRPAGVEHTVVIPTIGRPCLRRCLRALAASVGRGEGLAPAAVLVVDDRGPDAAAGPLAIPLEVAAAFGGRLRTIASHGRGPAAARNVGWRRARTPWVVFLDDDVVTTPDWAARLAADLAGADAASGQAADAASAGAPVGGVQGRLVVPLPEGRKPTDWERVTAGLASAAWATADMAYLRAALDRVGGFDERFTRAYREDADLALRVRRAGFTLRRGERVTTHPVRPASRWVSVSAQRGNADDALMRALHGPAWRRAAQVPGGRRPRHLALVGAAVVAACAAGARRRGLALLGAGAWLAGTAEFAAARLRPGPGTPAEVGVMLATSVVIPPAAVYHWGVGLLRHRGAASWPPPARAVLFDRDGTLVRDVPYNGDPAKVRPMPGAREAVAMARAAGLRVAVVSNQSGVARSLLTVDQVRAVNARVDALLGPFDAWAICPHGEDDGCGCRKPAPGLVFAAARAVGVAPHECVLIGDIGSDAAAAEAAGARAVLTPTAATRREELMGRQVAPDILTATRLALGLSSTAPATSRPAGAHAWPAAATGAGGAEA